MHENEYTRIILDTNYQFSSVSSSSFNNIIIIILTHDISILLFSSYTSATMV